MFELTSRELNNSVRFSWLWYLHWICYFDFCYFCQLLIIPNYLNNQRVFEHLFWLSDIFRKMKECRMESKLHVTWKNNSCFCNPFEYTKKCKVLNEVNAEQAKRSSWKKSAFYFMSSFFTLVNCCWFFSLSGLKNADVHK